MKKEEWLLNLTFALGIIAFVSGIIGEFLTLHEAYLILTAIGALMCLGVTWIGVWEEKRR
jgi:hypothetical protein